MRIDGKKIAAGIYEELKQKVLVLKQKGVTPHLVVILIGRDPASTKYVEQKQKRGTEIGAVVTVEYLDATIYQEELVKKIHVISHDPYVHGIIVQRPLPEHIDSSVIAKAVTVSKDVDGFHPDTPFTPPIVLSTLRMLEETHKEESAHQPFINWLKTKQIVLAGKGEAGGGPIIGYLKKHTVPFQIVDSKTESPDEITKKADIIISSVGRPNIIRANNIKPGAILIGIGLYKKDDGRLAGDYDEEEIKDIASIYTPSPGGMGPVNVAMLLNNLIEATKQ